MYAGVGAGADTLGVEIVPAALIDSISRFMASDKAFCTWLVGVNGFNPSFLEARVCADIGTLTLDADVFCMACDGVGADTPES